MAALEGDDGLAEAVMAKFFGVFFFFFQCNSILGNLISTAVLSTGLEVIFFTSGVSFWF